MKIAKEKNLILIRLEDGEEVIDSLKNAAKKFEIKSGLIIAGVGMLRNFKLAYYQGKGKYKENSYSLARELISMQGNIGRDEDNEIVVHLHLSLADKSNSVIGGHLIKGEVQYTNEIVVIKLDQVKLKRKLEESSGLKGIYFA